MQDVIIESSNQSSSLAANVRKVTIKKSRGIFSYMFDWLIKGLFDCAAADYELFAVCRFGKSEGVCGRFYAAA